MPVDAIGVIMKEISRKNRLRHCLCWCIGCLGLFFLGQLLGKHSELVYLRWPGCARI